MDFLYKQSLHPFQHIRSLQFTHILYVSSIKLQLNGSYALSRAKIHDVLERYCVKESQGYPIIVKIFNKMKK
jgi:hypothetical protein